MRTPDDGRALIAGYFVYIKVCIRRLSFGVRPRVIRLSYYAREHNCRTSEIMRTLFIFCIMGRT